MFKLGNLTLSDLDGDSTLQSAGKTMAKRPETVTLLDPNRMRNVGECLTIDERQFVVYKISECAVYKAARARQAFVGRKEMFAVVINGLHLLNPCLHGQTGNVLSPCEFYDTVIDIINGLHMLKPSLHGNDDFPS